MATRNKELKPPAELVEAIQASGDMTAPGPDSSATFSDDTPRQVRNRLLHEDPPQSLEAVKERLGITEGEQEGEEGKGQGPPSRQEKQFRHEEMAALQSKGAPKYQRNHPGAGKAGKGDQSVDSAIGIARDARKA